MSWKIKNVRSNSPLATPGPVEFTVRPLPGRYDGATHHAFATRVRALDAALQSLWPHPAAKRCISRVALRTSRLV